MSDDRFPDQRIRKTKQNQSKIRRRPNNSRNVQTRIRTKRKGQTMSLSKTTTNSGDNQGPRRTRKVTSRRTPVSKDFDGDRTDDAFGETVETEVEETFEDSSSSGGDRVINDGNRRGSRRTRSSRSVRWKSKSKRSKTKIVGSSRY